MWAYVAAGILVLTHLGVRILLSSRRLNISVNSAMIVLYFCVGLRKRSPASFSLKIIRQGD